MEQKTLNKMKNINVILKGATKLNKQEMKNIKGGRSYCDSLQEWANTYYETATSAQWDEWAGYWEGHCSH
ncbi:TIGR04149 family rSAM-modified RiPP [Proteiniphilum sp.]|uniref:TIGR04149 family rSAM-modified RiPP n=1 Tax=Proteiniphilum sp. TaxID=1926877 RepID=UPI0033226074